MSTAPSRGKFRGVVDGIQKFGFMLQQKLEVRHTRVVCIIYDRCLRKYQPCRRRGWRTPLNR